MGIQLLGRTSVLRVLFITLLCTFFALLRPTPALADTVRYLIDIGVSGSYQTTAQGWNNIYSGNSYDVPLVDSAGSVTNVKLTVTPTPPTSFGNTNGTTAGPYPATATQDTFYTSTTGYNGAPAQFVYTITGLSSAQTYNVTLYASRIGAGGEVRSALYTIGSSRAVLNASENVSNSVTISNVTPVNGQIVITQEKDPSNTNPNGFSYLGVIDIASQAVGVTQTVVSTPQAAGKKIVVLGSSTAAGVGASSFPNSWVGRFTTYMQSLNAANSVVNLGVGGYNTYTIMPTNWVIPAGRPSPDTSRNITYALSLKPDAIIVNMPSNDTAVGYPISEQQANFQTIVSLAAAAGVPIWITTTQPRNFDASGIAKQMSMRDWITATYGSRSIDFWSTVANADGTINPTYGAGDGVHLNDAGHQILFNRVVSSSLLSVLAAGAPQTTPTSTLPVVTPIPTSTPTLPGPVVDAGSAQTISAPTSAVALVGYASVATGRTIASYYWEEISARGANIQTPTLRTTSVSNLQPGTYTFRLTVTDSAGATGSATVTVTVLNTITTTDSGRYLIDVGSASYPATSRGWNNIYTGRTNNVLIVDSNGTPTSVRLTVSPTPPSGYENTYGTQTGPYIAAATRDSFYTSSTGYGGAPAQLTYTLSGLSSARTYTITLFASRIGANGENRSALFTVGSNRVVLNAAENKNTTVTIPNVAPVNGQIVITQQKDASNTNANGFAYLGVIDITAQAAPGSAPLSGLTVNAGSNQTVSAASGATALIGSATAAPGRLINSYAWSEVTSNGAKILSPNGPGTAVTNLLPGVYIFKLTATDTGGSVGSSTVTVTVVGTAATSPTTPVATTVPTPAPVSTPTPTPTPAPTPAPVVTPTTNSGHFLIDFGHPDSQTTATGWNNIYSGHEANIALVDSTGAASPLTLSVTPALPGSFGNTSGTTAGPYPATATQDSFFTSTTGYYGSPAKFTYTISGLSSSRTYTIALYASRIGSGGEVRTTLYTVNGKTAVLNAAENVSNVATISGVTPINGQIIVTQEKDASNNNANGFSYLGVMEITVQNVVMSNTSQLASVLGAMMSGNTYTSETGTSDQTTHVFTRNLTFGMVGTDVQKLQKYLNTHGFTVANTGEGSLGHETTTFGQGTKQALTQFQNAHQAEILTPAGLTKGSGVLGTLTRQYISAHP